MPDRSFVERVQAREVVVAIVGLGDVGLPLAIRYPAQGFRPLGCDEAPRMKKQYARLATTSVELARTTTFRVRIVEAPSAWNIWERLRGGT